MRKGVAVAVVGAVLGMGGMCGVAQGQAAQGTASAGQEANAVVPADQQATKEQLANLFEVMKVREQTQKMMQMLPAIMRQQVEAESKDMAARLPAGKQLTAEQQQSVNRLTEKFMDRAMHLYSPEELIGDMTQVYQRHLTREDVDALISFYSSPAGQHFLTEQPEIMREYMGMVMGGMKDRMTQLNQELIEDLGKATGAPTPLLVAPPPPPPPPPAKQ